MNRMLSILRRIEFSFDFPRYRLRGKEDTMLFCSAECSTVGNVDFIEFQQLHQIAAERKQQITSIIVISR